MVRIAAGAGALAGVGGTLLLWQVTRESPVPLLILLGVALCVGGYVLYSDAAEKERRERVPGRYRATALAVLDFAQSEVQEAQEMLDAGFTNRLAERGVHGQRNAYQAVADRLLRGIEESPTEGGSA